MNKNLPVGKFARGSVAATTMAKVGAKKLGFLSKKPFLSQVKAQNAKALHDEDVAGAIFKGLSQLRGTALKLGQFLSMEAGIVPEAYRKELFKSHYQAPPLNRAVIRKVMQDQFGKPPEELFQSFNPDAFAAASLGQVHEAVAFDGRRLAVKIQYPGIAGSIKTDMSLAKQFLLPFFKSDYVGKLTRELEARLFEEVNYRLELENTLWFHENLKVPGVRVPKPEKTLSSEFVLTTRFIEGLPFDKFLEANPSQETRNRFAQLLYDIFIKGTFELATLHADPNPGNYIFGSDGTLGFIDFGCVKRLDKDVSSKLAALWRAHIRGDRKTILGLYGELGLKPGKSKNDLNRLLDEVLLPFGEWIALPFQSERFDFGKNAHYVEMGPKFIGSVINHESFGSFTTDTLFIDRTIHGLFRIFTQMGAQISLVNPFIY